MHFRGTIDTSRSRTRRIQFITFIFVKLLKVSNKDALSIRNRLLCSAIKKRNKELHHVSKELSQYETFLFKQLSLIDFYILNRSITSHNKKLLQKLLNTQHKKLSSLTRNCSLLTFTSNETITNLTQYELCQEEFDLLKAGLYFSIQPDKIQKFEIFTTFEKIHRSFISNLKSEETKNQIKAHLSYLANSYFYNYTNLLGTYYVNIAPYETLEKIKILL